MKLSSPVILPAIVLAATAAIGQPPPSVIRPEPIARAARYGDKLIVTVGSAAEGQVWAATVTAADRSFAPVTILLKVAGSIPPAQDRVITTVMTSPDGRYDLVVSIEVPAQFPTPTLAAARYQSLLQREPRELVDAIALSVHRQLFPPPRHQGTKATKQD